VNFSKRDAVKKKLEINSSYDTRNKFEIYKALSKKEKISIIAKVNEENVLKSLSGASKIKTIFCNENGKYSFFLSDRYGFNNPDFEWDKKNINYFLLGNSFTQGACVNRPADIASQIRKISKKSALNMGYRNHGPLSQLAALREYYQPGIKNVIWFYSEDNDLNILNIEIKSSILTKYPSDNNFSQNLSNKQNQIDNKIKKKIENDYIDQKKIKLLNIIKLKTTRLFLYSFFPNKYKPVSKNLKFNDLFKKVLIQAKKFSENNNAKFFFVYLPDYKRYSLDNYSNENYIKIKNFVNSSNINFLDMNTIVFEKEQDPLIFFPYRMYGHYNEIGYKKIAEKILQEIL
jgi:hypothetical protein